MSAFIIDRRDDGATVLTDGAVCEPRGGQYVLTGVHEKIIRFPHIPAVMVYAGAVNVVENMLWDALQHLMVFETLVGRLPEVVEEAVSDTRAKYPRLGAACCFATVGWSQRNSRWETWVVEKGADKPAELERYDTPTTIALPCVDPDQYALALERGGADRLAVLREIMQQQRMQKEVSANRSDLGEVYTVGGCIHHTEITREGISSPKVIHEWPDKLGEPLDPSRGAA